MVCGECLGEYRKYYAEEHIKKYPSHQEFMSMWLIDPLSLSNLDEWLKIRTNRLLTGIKTTDKLPEPLIQIIDIWLI